MKLIQIYRCEARANIEYIVITTEYKNIIVLEKPIYLSKAKSSHTLENLILRS